MSDDGKIQVNKNIESQKIILTKPIISNKLRIIDVKELSSSNHSYIKEHRRSSPSRYFSSNITKNNSKIHPSFIKRNVSGKSSIRTSEEQDYIINLLKKNIQKRRNILPNLKLNAANRYDKNINKNNNSSNINPKKYYSKKVNNNNKKFIGDYERYVKYNNHAHKLPKIAKCLSTLNENNTQQDNSQNQSINYKYIINTSTNTDAHNTHNTKKLLLKEKNSDNFFKNIEKKIELRKKCIDMHNMIERIEECKKNKNSQENSLKDEHVKRESEPFFISGVINYDRENLELLKKDLGMPSESKEIINMDQGNNENNKNQNIGMSLEEMEKLKSKDQKLILEINKKLIDKDKIINISKINLIPDTIFTGRYKQIKKMEMIAYKIKNKRLPPLNLGINDSSENLGKKKLETLEY